MIYPKQIVIQITFDEIIKWCTKRVTYLMLMISSRSDSFIRRTVKEIAHLIDLASSAVLPLSLIMCPDHQNTLCSHFTKAFKTIKQLPD